MGLLLLPIPNMKLRVLLSLYVASLCQGQGLIDSGDDSYSLETVKSLQNEQIDDLKRILAEKENRLQEIENEHQDLLKTIQKQEEEKELLTLKHQNEKNLINQEIEGSKIIVNFIMNVLTNSQDEMERSEYEIIQQAEILEQAHADNEGCKKEIEKTAKQMFDTQEMIYIQNDQMKMLKNSIREANTLNSSYFELDDWKPSESCNLPDFVISMAKTLSDEQKKINNLKEGLGEDKKVHDYLESIAAEVEQEYNTAVESNEQYETLKTYQNTIKKQLESMAKLRLLAAGGINMEAADEYKEDTSGSLVTASSCQCLPEIEEDKELYVVLESQNQTAVSTWTPWQYHSCFHWVKDDNSTSDCGTGWKERKRVKNVNSVSWEEETEKVSCGQCNVPGLQLGTWSGWGPCEGGQNKRYMLSAEGHTVRAQSEGRECRDDPQCAREYRVLSDPWRRVKYTNRKKHDYECDSDLITDWYRFQFESRDEEDDNSTWVNAWIPTEKAPEKYLEDAMTCGTFTASWTNSSLPQVGESPQDITILFHWGDNGDGERDSQPAKVVACQKDEEEPFYLYYLTQPSECDLGYCATTVPVSELPQP